jgi:hypothetical protein
MGERPDGMTVERLDNDGDYEPSNCAWATKEEQALNRKTTHRVWFQNKQMCLSSVARIIGRRAEALYIKMRYYGITAQEVVDCYALLLGFDIEKSQENG